jgi:hypothetical protein
VDRCINCDVVIQVWSATGEEQSGLVYGFKYGGIYQRFDTMVTENGFLAAQQLGRRHSVSIWISGPAVLGPVPYL